MAITNTNFQISSTSVSSWDSSSGYLTDGGFVVSYNVYGGNESFNLTVQMFNADNTKQGGEIFISDMTTSDVFITGLLDGSYVVIWNTPGDYSSVYMQKVSSNGELQGDVFLVKSGHETGASAISTNDGGFIVTWNSFDVNTKSDIRMQEFDSSGNKVGAESVVNSKTIDSQYNS
jgi:hypothetical protein